MPLRSLQFHLCEWVGPFPGPRVLEELVGPDEIEVSRLEGAGHIEKSGCSILHACRRDVVDGLNKCGLVIATVDEHQHPQGLVVPCCLEKLLLLLLGHLRHRHIAERIGRLGILLGLEELDPLGEFALDCEGTTNDIRRRCMAAWSKSHRAYAARAVERAPI